MNHKRIERLVRKSQPEQRWWMSPMNATGAVAMSTPTPGSVSRSWGAGSLDETEGSWYPKHGQLAKW